MLPSKWLVLLVFAWSLGLGRALLREGVYCDQEIGCFGNRFREEPSPFGELDCTVTGNNYSISYDSTFITTEYLSLGLLNCSGGCLQLNGIEDGQQSGILQGFISEADTCLVTGCFWYRDLGGERVYHHFPLRSCRSAQNGDTITGSTPTDSASTADTTRPTEDEDTSPEVTEAETSQPDVPATPTTGGPLPAAALPLAAMVASFSALLLIGVTIAVLLLLTVILTRRKQRRKGMNFVKVPFDDDKFDGQFQPPAFGIGLDSFKFLSESQPSILCALYQAPIEHWVQETLEPTNSKTPSQTLSEDPVSNILTHSESTLLEDKLSYSLSEVPMFPDSSEFPPRLEGGDDSQGHRDTVRGDSINLDSSPVNHKDMGYLDLVSRRGLGDGVTTPHSVKTLLNMLSMNPAAGDKGYSSNDMSEGYLESADKDQQGDFVADVVSNPLDSCLATSGDEDTHSFGMPAHSLDFDFSTASDTRDYMDYTPDQSLDVLGFETTHRSDSIPRDYAIEERPGSTPSEMVMFDFAIPTLSPEVHHSGSQYVGHGPIRDDQSDYTSDQSDPLQLDDQSKSLIHVDLGYVHDQTDSPQPIHNERSNYFESDQLDSHHFVGPAHKQSISSHYIGSASDQSDSSHLYAQSESLHFAWPGPDEAVKQASNMVSGTPDLEIYSLDAIDADFMPPKLETSSFELDKELSTFGGDVTRLDRGVEVNLDHDPLTCEAYSNGGSTGGYIATLDSGFLSSFGGDTGLDHAPSSADTGGEHIFEGGSELCDLSEPFSPPLFPHCVDDVQNSMTTPFHRLTGQDSSGFSCSTSSGSGYVIAGSQFRDSEQ